MKAKEKAAYQALYEGYVSSGKTQAKYCKEEGVAESKLKRAIAELRKAGLLAPSERKKSINSVKPIKFTPVRINRATDTELSVETQKSWCEILFNGKTGIRIENRESLEQLVKLFQEVVR